MNPGLLSAVHSDLFIVKHSSLWYLSHISFYYIYLQAISLIEKIQPYKGNS